MQTPAQIVFHGIDHSDAFEQRVHEKVAKLEQHFNSILSCRVVVEYHHKNTSHEHKRGEPYLVTVNVSLPGEDFVATSDRGDDPALMKEHQDAGVALRAAFAAMERQLRDSIEKRRTEHRTPTH